MIFSVDDAECVSVLGPAEVASLTDISDVDPSVDILVVSVFDVSEAVLEDSLEELSVEIPLVDITVACAVVVSSDVDAGAASVDVSV